MLTIFDVVPVSSISTSESPANALASGGTVSPLISSWPWIVAILALVLVVAVLVALLIKEKEKHKE